MVRCARADPVRNGGSRTSKSPEWPARKTQAGRRTAVTRRFFSILFSVFALGMGSGPARAQDKSITVFAAASMKNALDDFNAAFLKATGTKVVTSYAASSALAKQLEQGAPADIFASADLDWMDYSAQNKSIKDDTRVNLLGN